jgi:preprotein translocase subunit YajC
MNTLTLILLLQDAAQNSSGSTNGGGSLGGGSAMWIMLLLMFVVMYFFMIRPQRKQQKELEAFQNSLKKGDKVIIGNSGIFGEIVEVDERTALVRVDGDTKLRVAKQVLTKDVTDVQK